MAEAVETLAGSKQPPQRDVEAERAAADRISTATQWQLMWWRFRKHRGAMVAAVVIIIFYTVVLFADFFAISSPTQSDAQLSLLPPQPIHFFDEGEFRPYVNGLSGKRDPKTFKRVYQPDPDIKLFLTLFAEGYTYKLWGLFETNLHLLGVKDG